MTTTEAVFYAIGVVFVVAATLVAIVIVGESFVEWILRRTKLYPELIDFMWERANRRRDGRPKE